MADQGDGGITEHRVFQLTVEEIELIELIELIETAPGLDLKQDTLQQMAFRPLIADKLVRTDPRVYNSGEMGLKQPPSVP